MERALLCTYESEKAIVRVYSDNRTPEDRQKVWEGSARWFYAAIQKQKAQRKEEAE